MGQYASEIRANGYQGHILSFEPLAAAFFGLKERSLGDPAWQCILAALGSQDSSATINVSGLSEASSLLQVGAATIKACPETTVVRTETVSVRQLDKILVELGIHNRRAHLKLDVQGFEKEVLLGAKQSLSQVYSAEVELSLIELYRGQPLIGEMLQVLNQLQFFPVWFSRGFSDPGSRDLLQIDCLLMKHAR
jgi:FkbM family methyltransferase